MADDKDRGFESQEERRSHDRSRLIVDVFFDGKDVTGVASTKDISAGGLYMNTQAEIPEGSLLFVRIPFPQRRPGGLQCRGCLQQSRPRCWFEVPGSIGRRPAMLEREVSNG